MTGDRAQFEELTRINIQDLLASFGLEHVRPGRGLLSLLCRYPAQRFARQVIAFDRMVAQMGLREASASALLEFCGGLEIVDQGHLPQEGPLLVLANHPGMSDTLALFASLPRPDLRIVGAERPFLKALPNIDRRLIYVPEDPARRMGVVRQVTGHLRQGGAILTFPAGQIEPDPACMPGAVESLQGWSNSLEVFARLAPQARVVVAIVSGVIWPPSLRHPLTRLRRRPKDRERLAAALQLLAITLRPGLRPGPVRVAFSPSICAGDLLARGDQGTLTRAIAEQARALLEHCQDRAFGAFAEPVQPSPLAAIPAPPGK